MQVSELNALSTQVLAAAFLLSLIFGVITQRTHFCTMGAVSDIVNMGDWTRMRQWGLAIGVAMGGFALLAYAGLIDASKTIHASNRWFWLSGAVGGALFGFGMVLASGCGSKTLVRVGSGNLKSLIVMVVLGLSAFATLKGITAVARVQYLDDVGIRLRDELCDARELARTVGQHKPQLEVAVGCREPARDHPLHHKRVDIATAENRHRDTGIRHLAGHDRRDRDGPGRFDHELRPLQ